MNVIDIWEGWKNYYFKKVEIEEIADIRRAICMTNQCKKYSTKGLYVHCNKCGCPIEKKIRSKKACPLKFWPSFAELIKRNITINK